MNAVFINTVAIAITFSSIGTPNALIRLIKPLKSPVATKTGITGIKTSPKILDNFCGIDIFAYKSFFKSVDILLLAPATIS